MKPIAISKAREHLDLVKEASLRLSLQKGFKPYEQAWSEVLSQVSRFYSKLEQGSKGCSGGAPWFGRKKQERKTDAMLAYLHHARNSDEHGLDYITQRGADSVVLGFPETKEVKVGFEMMIDDKGAMHVRNPRVHTPNGGINHIEILNPRVDLVPVSDRGVIYNPPQIHAGKPLVDATPERLAQKAILYLEDMLAEASKFPPH